MTIKNEMSKDADDKSDIDSEKNTSENISPGYTGGKSSEKVKNDKPSGMFSSMLITILLALSVAIVIAYMYMPEKFNQYLSFISTVESTSDEVVPVVATNQDSIPVASADVYAMNNQPQQPDWAAQQRADFEKRRAEFEKRSAGNYPQQWQSATPAEPPQWMKDRQAEMEKQRAQYIKDRQAEMENQRAQYMKAMSEQQARWEENNKRNQMRMNSYQQHAAYNQPYNTQRPVVTQPQNQQYIPANQPPPQYYNRRPPAYNYAPYGWQGNGYR